MSDAQHLNGLAQLDPLFAAAFQKVEEQRLADAAAENGETPPAAGAGEANNPPADPGAGAAPGDPNAGQLPGAPSAGDIANGAAAGTQGERSAGEPNQGPPAQPGTGGDLASAEAAATGREAAEVTQLLGNAQAKANERLDEAIRNQALQEYRESINPELLDALRYSPTELVGTEVPSIQRGAQPGQKMRITDSSQARQYIEDASKLIERGVDDLAGQKQKELLPLRNVIQESFLLFQNNPDIVEGSKTFDKELATRFATLAQSFAFEHQGRVIGYQGNVQPMLNELRANLAKERGASGERVNQAQRAEQQRQAAAGQPRTPQGQFTNPDQRTPQAGIPSTTGMSPNAGEDDDYGTFWKSSGVGHLRQGITPI